MHAHDSDVAFEMKDDKHGMNVHKLVRQEEPIQVAEKDIQSRDQCSCQSVEPMSRSQGGSGGDGSIS